MASSSSRPPAEPEEYIPNLSSYETGPAKNTAGPHHSDIANKLDPRVDSDLNNRAQYAPGTTMTTNVHPNATAYAANPQAQNTLGPHGSDMMNRVDPRVNSRTGETTTKTTNNEGTGPRREPVNTGDEFAGGSGSANPGNIHSSTTAASAGRTGGVVGGSSTGAPAVPSPVSSPSGYSREQSSYNSATGTGYTPPHHQQPASTSSSARTGSEEGKGMGSAIKNVVAGIHGAGESIRGTFNAGVDRAFNEPEGVAKNEAIGKEGEYEAQTGEFAPSTKQREGFNVRDRA